MSADKPGRVWPGVGVGAVVILGRDLLMVQRAGAHGAGLWSVPGGWVEFGEDPLETAVREVKEETGATVRPVARAGWASHVHTDVEPHVHAVTLFVDCRYVEGEWRVIEPDKCPKVEWVPISEVTRRPLFQPFGYWWPRRGAMDW